MSLTEMKFRAIKFFERNARCESTSAVKFSPLKNNAYLFLANQFGYHSLSHLSY